MKDSQRSSITVRLGAELLQSLRISAAKNGHSMNAEIAKLLKFALDQIAEEERHSDSIPMMDAMEDWHREEMFPRGVMLTEALREEAEELEAQIPGIKWELDQAHKRLGEMITTLTETDNPVTDDKIALLQTQTRFYRVRLEEAESRLRRIKRVLGE